MNAPRSLVVLVEDEALLRLVATDSLADAGFDVRSARDSHEALAILEGEPDAVGVLFTDINMPGNMDGLELARRVKARWPWIGVLLTSGQVVLDKRAMPSGARFVLKPYPLRSAIAQIEKLLVEAGFDAAAL